MRLETYNRIKYVLESGFGYTEALRTLNEEGCSCTAKQESGEDHTVCRACTAGGLLNDMEEVAREEVVKQLKLYTANKEVSFDPVMTQSIQNYVESLTPEELESQSKKLEELTDRLAKWNEGQDPADSSR